MQCQRYAATAETRKVAPKVGNRRQQRAKMHRNVERQTLILPATERGRQDEMCGARDRQKLRDALDERQDDDLYKVYGRRFHAKSLTSGSVRQQSLC